MDFKTIATEVAKAGAPLLGTALMGPVGGVIGSLIATKLGAPSSSPSDLMASLQNPDAAIKLKELEMEHKQSLLDYQAKLAQMEYTDVQSARDRETKLAAAGSPDRTPENFLVLALASLILVYVTSIFVNETPAQAKITSGVINLLSMIMGQGLGYLYGIQRFANKNMIQNITTDASLATPFK